MIRRPPRSTLDRSSAASDVYKRQTLIRAMGPAISRELFSRSRSSRNGVMEWWSDGDRKEAHRLLFQHSITPTLQSHSLTPLPAPGTDGDRTSSIYRAWWVSRRR